MTLPGVILLSIITAIVIIVRMLSDGIKKDLTVFLQQHLERLLRSAARRFLSPKQAEDFITWFEAERQELVEHGGSGLGLVILFIIFTGPYYTWRLRRGNPAARS